MYNCKTNCSVFSEYDVSKTNWARANKWYDFNGKKYDAATTGIYF